MGARPRRGREDVGAADAMNMTADERRRPSCRVGGRRRSHVDSLEIPLRLARLTILAVTTISILLTERAALPCS
jgi:hypothetical protein